MTKYLIIALVFVSSLCYIIYLRSEVESLEQRNIILEDTLNNNKQQLERYKQLDAKKEEIIKQQIDKNKEINSNIESLKRELDVKEVTPDSIVNDFNILNDKLFK